MIPTSPSPGRAALYDVEIRHQRSTPVTHGFTYRARSWVIDADAPPRLPFGLRWAASFRATDHVGGHRSSLRLGLDAILAEHGISVPTGSITTMANPRVFGYVFNPLSLHWCHAASGELVAVIAEVHNTYGERHSYVLRTDEAGRAEVDKQFYVSPFNPVDGSYRMSLPEPGERLSITLTLHREGEAPFIASVRGRLARSDARLGTALRTPVASRAVMARIRRHGIALWLKGLRPAPRPSHPTTRTPTSPPTHRWTNGSFPMYSTSPERVLAPRPDYVDATRWPDVATEPHHPLRARIARSLMHRAVRRLPIRLVMPDGSVEGRGGPDAPAMTLVRPESMYERLGATGLIGFGEAFMAGDWVAGDTRRSTQPEALPANEAAGGPGLLPVDDLAAMLAVFAEQMSTLIPPWLQRMRQAAVLRAPGAHDNTVNGSRSNISHHYDLSNDLFKLFLDPSLSYSSALFADDPGHGDEPLVTAQHRKIDRLLDVARVTAGSRVLEIGTGWGELAIRAAGRGAHVTTVTLSSEQAELAEKRIAEAGLSERVDVRLQDYREIQGTFDAIVSVEMIEAVGANHWGEYFGALHDRLAPGGRVGLQAITMPHDRMIASMHTYTWILKYIFPGGQLPSVQEVDTQARAAGLRVTENLGFGAHYAETLKRWRASFEARAAEVDELGFDAVFRRMWSLYLGYSEAGFSSGYLNVNQFVLVKGES